MVSFQVSINYASDNYTVELCVKKLQKIRQFLSPKLRTIPSYEPLVLPRSGHMAKQH